MNELGSAKRIVVKVGSSLLVGPDGAAHAEWLADFAADVARLRARGQQVLVVSSGAVPWAVAAWAWASVSACRRNKPPPPPASRR